MVVKETFVRRHFPGEEPLGRQIRFGGPERPAFEIVGVVAVRMPLVASAAEVFRLVIGGGLRLGASGVVLGVIAAALAARALATQLFAVEPTDPWRLGGMAALILAVAVVACLVPAWRAIRVDPVVALLAD